MSVSITNNKQSKLYNKNFSILIVGQIISLFGSAIQRFALSLYLLDLTGSASIFATILALSVIPIIILSPFAGVMADRFNKRNIMVALDTLSGIIIVIYGVILFTGNDHYIIVAVMMLLLSGISTLYQPSVTASIPVIVGDEHLMKANGMVYQVSSLSNFLGPIIAGILYGFLGIKGVIVINGISFFVSAAMELFLTIPFEKVESKQSPIQMFRAEISEAVQYLKNENRILFRMIFTSGLYNLFLVPVFSVGAPYIIKIMLGMSSQMYGLAEGVIAFGMIIGAFIISQKPNLCHINRIYFVLYPSCLSMFIMGAALFLPDTASGRLWSFVLFTFFGMGIMLSLGIANVISATYIQQAAPATMLGKISAFGAAFATLCVPLGQVVFGGLLELLKEHVAILVILSAICTFGVTLIVRWNVRQVQD